MSTMHGDASLSETIVVEMLTDILIGPQNLRMNDLDIFAGDKGIDVKVLSRNISDTGHSVVIEKCDDGSRVRLQTTKFGGVHNLLGIRECVDVLSEVVRHSNVR